MKEQINYTVSFYTNEIHVV